MHPDYRPYIHLTSRARLEKSVNSLLGIIEGIAIDSAINSSEVAFLNLWLEEHAELRGRHPYNELVPAVQAAVADGVLTQDEHDDIVWLCERLRSTEYFDRTTSDLQRLHAILAGIVSDGKITETELVGLSAWLADHEHLKTCWPYDEIDSLIVGVMKDKRIDEQEHEVLRRFFSEFVAVLDNRTIVTPVVQERQALVGLCAVCPEIEFCGIRPRSAFERRRNSTSAWPRPPSRRNAAHESMCARSGTWLVCQGGARSRSAPRAGSRPGRSRSSAQAHGWAHSCCSSTERGIQHRPIGKPRAQAGHHRIRQGGDRCNRRPLPQRHTAPGAWQMPERSRRRRSPRRSASGIHVLKSASQSPVKCRRTRRPRRTVTSLRFVPARLPQSFDGATFCFTGASTRYTRSSLIQLVEGLGGEVTSAVSKSLRYLVIGAEGNPCWAYACYGRKVEKAVQLRKAGARLLIVHENDFHDAVADAR